MKNILKGTNREVLALGLLICSVGLQIMPLTSKVTNTLAGAGIIIVGIFVIGISGKQEE
jgi:hypothetical protein